jgi:hypothetical protein
MTSFSGPGSSRFVIPSPMTAIKANSKSLGVWLQQIADS